MKICAISNLKICGDKTALKRQIYALCEAGIGEIVLREKNLSVSQYRALFFEILQICESYGVRLFLHNFIEFANEIEYKFIWLPLEILQNSSVNLAKFEKIVTSAHNEFEAKIALNLGANALCLSHIFATDCKADLEPKGLDLIKSVRKFWDGEIYALGGINSQNFKSAIQTGADNIALMSSAMRAQNAKEFVSEFAK